MATCACHAQESSDQGSGCYIPKPEVPDFFALVDTAQAFGFGAEDIEPRSGDRLLDRALAQTLTKLARTFEVLPGFAYYRDIEQANARATTEILLERTDGSVLFGLRLLDELLARPENPDAGVVAVCAHEFGHIVSYKYNMINDLAPNPYEPFRAEQFADFLAGYYSGLRKLERPSFPAEIFVQTQQGYGGPTRGSHGTGQERAEAVIAGFKSAYEENVSSADAKNVAFQFAMNRW